MVALSSTSRSVHGCNDSALRYACQGLPNVCSIASQVVESALYAMESGRLASKKSSKGIFASSLLQTKMRSARAKSIK